jgi:replicative DNA helicase
MIFEPMETTPEHIESEKSLIATLCDPFNVNYAETLIGELQATDFMHPLHRDIWKAMVPLVATGTELNLPTIFAEMERQGSPFPFTDLVTVLADLGVGNPTYLVTLIKEASTRRRIQALAGRAGSRAGNPMEDLDSVIHDLMHGASNLSGELNDEDEFTAATVFTEYVNKGVALSPLGKRIGCFGLDGVDHYIEIPVAEPVVIGARPGCGKTALGIQISIESKLRYPDMRPYFVSLELTKPKLLARFAAYLSGSDARDWRTGSYGAHVGNLRMNEALMEDIHMSCPVQGTPWPKLEARIRRQVARNKVNLVVIDYFGYIGRAKIAAGSNAAYAYGEVMDGVTALAKDLNIALILLAQLKQPADLNVAKRPHEGQFADSDRPYRDSNVVVMLWRDKDGNTKIYNPKNRDGVPGKEWDLAFDGPSGRFSTTYRETAAPGQDYGEGWS